MTILSKVISKVKTLIEYAKFGMFYVKAYNYDNRNDRLMPLHLPKGVQWFDSGLIQYATALTGHVKRLGVGSKYAYGNTTIEYINLPKVTEIWGWEAFRYMYVLKECRLPSFRTLNNMQFCDCPELEIFEVGQLKTFENGRVLTGVPKLHTFICGKDTAVSLYLQGCPLLTQECIHNIIDNLADMTGSKALTLQVHQDVYNRISEEYKTKLSNKNWNLAVA